MKKSFEKNNSVKIGTEVRRDRERLENPKALSTFLCRQDYRSEKRREKEKNREKKQRKEEEKERRRKKDKKKKEEKRTRKRKENEKEERRREIKSTKGVVHTLVSIHTFYWLRASKRDCNRKC